MIINHSTLRFLPWQKPAINTDATQKDFQLGLATLPNAAQSISAKAEAPSNTDTGSNGGQKFDEAFARMMVNLKMATDSLASDSTPDAAAIAANQTSISTEKDSAVSASSLTLSANQEALKIDKSATEQFMDYMKQSDSDKIREQMTGVSKEEYENMSPEEKAALDKKVEVLTKEQNRIAQETVKAKIAMAKAELA